MRPSELTANVVREELEHLIKNYSDRLGSIIVDTDNEYGDDETSCVYYADQDGEPISLTRMGYDDVEEIDLQSVVLKTPVCIVGLWIENFHPEFKNDEVIREVLVRNHTIRHASTPFSPEVKLLLIKAQDQQDTGDVWGKIDLDKADSVW